MQNIKLLIFDLLSIFIALSLMFYGLMRIAAALIGK